MQGELSEIDIRSILQLVELGQRTGQLLVTTDRGPSANAPAGRAWFVFFVNGQIVYAGDPAMGLRRLQGLAQRYRLQLDWTALAMDEGGQRHAPEYGCLWALIERRLLLPDQAREMLETMVRETLFELLSLHQGTFVFETDGPLMPQLTQLAITPLMTAVTQQVQEWKQFYPQLQSPDQCPVIVDPDALRRALPPSTLSALLHYADQQMSLRQLAQALNRDIVAVARAIYPCVQRGWVSFTPIEARRFSVRPPVGPIACIDDAVTVGHMVSAMLQPHGYDVVAIADPIVALSKVFEIQPQLILCDIDMPYLNGYELCAMLRQSTQFRHVPIIMLTGKDGFIDRVRAKMVGATNYLAKPFAAEELLLLLEQYARLPSLL
jgi:twitching motility two-component system response regulator PilG